MRYIVLLCLLSLAIHLEAVLPSRKALPNGLRIMTMPSGASQLVSIEVLIDCSAFDEPATVQGIRLVLLRSMLLGSALHDGTAIRNTMLAAGGILDGRLRQDALEFSVTIPVNNLPTAFAMLDDILCHPLLDETQIRAVIAQAQAEANMPPAGSPVDLADSFAWSLLFSGHPYATAGKGTTESLTRITPALVRLAYQYFIRPERTIISVVGQNLPPNVQNDIAQRFSTWERSAVEHDRATVPIPPLTASQLIVRESPVSNTCIMLAFPVCGYAKSDALTLQLIDTLLSGGTGSRLFRELRERRHLAYDVSTRFPLLASDSYLSLYAVTNGREMEATKVALLEELARLQREPVPDSEILRARTYLKMSFQLRRQSTAQYAFELAWHELLGFSPEYESNYADKIDAISAQDIRRVANTFFTHYYLIVVLPQLIEPAKGSTVGLSTYYGGV